MLIVLSVLIPVFVLIVCLGIINQPAVVSNVPLIVMFANLLITAQIVCQGTTQYRQAGQ